MQKIFYTRLHQIRMRYAGTSNEQEKALLNRAEQYIREYDSGLELSMEDVNQLVEEHFAYYLHTSLAVSNR